MSLLYSTEEVVWNQVIHFAKQIDGTSWNVQKKWERSEAEL